MSDIFSMIQKTGSDIHESQINSPWMYYLMREWRNKNWKQSHCIDTLWMQNKDFWEQADETEKHQNIFPPIKALKKI